MSRLNFTYLDAEIERLNNNLDIKHKQYVLQWLEEYKQLKGLEQQGLVIKLPCKVGDKIYSFRWSIKGEKYEMCTSEVKNVRCDTVDGSVTVSDGEQYRVFGKTVFLTKEEAEQKLKELNGELVNE